MIKMITDLTKDATVKDILIRSELPALPDQITPSGPGYYPGS